MARPPRLPRTASIGHIRLDKSRRSSGHLRAGFVIYLSDEPLVPALKVIESYGFANYVIQRIEQFKDALWACREGEMDVAAILVDLYLDPPFDERNMPDELRYASLTGGVDAIARIIAEFRNALPNVPIVAVTTRHFDKEFIELCKQWAKDWASVFPVLDVAFENQFSDVIEKLIVLRPDAPPISFGILITPEAGTIDGAHVEIIRPVYERLLSAIRKNPNVIHELGWRMWEEIIAGSYVRDGFDEVIVTPGSGDLGRDVIAIKKGFGSIKFIEQVKAYSPGHLVTANDVRAVLGVLQGEHNASKAIVTTTSEFAPNVRTDRLLMPFFPHRLELVDREGLLERLSLPPRFKLAGEA